MLTKVCGNEHSHTVLTGIKIGTLSGGHFQEDIGNDNSNNNSNKSQELCAHRGPGHDLRAYPYMCMETHVSPSNSIKEVLLLSTVIRKETIFCEII